MNELLEHTLFRTYVASGGPLMFVLVPCSILLLGATIQSSLRLRRGRVAPARALDAARELAAESAGAPNSDARARYLEASARDASPLARTIRLSLERLHPDGPRVVSSRRLDEAIEESAAHVADDLYEELGVFATLYTVAPLIGLLGTILGLIVAFQAFGSDKAEDLVSLSDGIQQALVTTLWGLAIAIPAYVVAQSFQSRVRRYEREILPDLARRAVVALLSASHRFEDPIAESAPPPPPAKPPEGAAAS